MKFDGKFDAKLGVDGLGAHANAHHHIDSLPAHAPSDAILVQDAQLLFGGDYKRSGVDLIVSNDHQEVVLHDYFKGEKRAALASPDGAHLSGDVINALTGHQQFAQADGSASVNKVIGHVTKLTGTATAIRNGVSIILNNGDNVEKGDVVQAGSNSTLGLTFIDGTVFGLSSNARMVLNEMIYDPNGSNNSSLMSLVQGTISFVAGETAKHGDMKVETPVATMGIRGTAVLVEIDFVVPGQAGTPNASFRVLVEPDGTTGSYILFDRVTMTAIATVNQAGTETNISNGIVNFNPSAPLSADAQRIISEVFSQRFTDLTNPRGETHFTDSLTPQSFSPVKLADGTVVPITVQLVQAATSGETGRSGTSGSTNDHIPGKPDIITGNSSLVERASLTGSSAIDTTSGLISFSDINIGDRPTVSTSFGSFTYQHNGGAPLNALQLADIKAVEVDLVVHQTPDNTNAGSATWIYNVPDRAFDFLAAGEVLTLTYIARVDNNFKGNNEFSQLAFTITITGTNDVPVITTGPQAIGFAGGTSVPGGELPPDAPTSGTLAFNDVDLTDTHTVATALTGASLLDSHGVVLLDRAALEARAPFPMSIFATALSALVAADSTGTGAGTIHWDLADLPVYLADFIPAGETLTLTYTVTLKDSQGTTSEQIVTVTITGTDSPAVVWIATTTPGSTAGGLWRNAANWETGTVPTATDDVIIITDQLHGLTPAYPVTIDAPAFAHSVTMNDFSLGLLPPHLINQSLLTIGRAFSVNADAIVDNSATGTISVGGPMTFAGTSVFNNAGAIVLAEGGAFTNQSQITNSGTIEVSGGTLSVSVAIANANGGITIDSAGVMTLNGATITGGTVTDNGVIDVTGNSTINGGAHVTGGGLTVESGKTLTLNTATISGTAITDLGTIDVTGNSTINSNASVTGGGLTVESGKTLTLNTATISGTAITDLGIIDVTGNATINGGASVTGGGLTVESGKTLTLNTATISGTAITDLGIIDVTGNATINGGASVTGGGLTVESGKTLTLNTATISGTAITDNGVIDVTGNSTINSNASVTGGGLTVESGKTLTLNTATISGTAITDLGTIDVTGNSTINSNASVSGGGLTVESGKTLTLNTATISGTAITDNGVIDVTGNSTINSGASVTGGGLTVESAATLTLNTATISGTAVTDHGTIDVTGNSALNGNASVTGGSLTVESAVTLTLNTATISGTSITDHGTIDVTGTGTSTLNGGASITGGGIVTVESGSTLNLASATITGGSLGNANSIHVSGTGNTLDHVTISNSGTIEIQNNTLTITGGSITGGGSIQIDAGAVLDLNATVSGATPAAAQTIVFNGAGSSTLEIDTASFGGRIAGLGDTDRIDLQTFTYGLNTITATYSGDHTGGVLTIYDGVHTPIELTLVGDYIGAHFTGLADTDGSTIIRLDHDDTAPAFVPGEDSPTASLSEHTATTGSTALDSSTPAGGTIDFTDLNLVDRPTATIGTQSVTWTQGTSDLFASLTPTEIAAIQHALESGLSLTASGNTNTGAIGWTYSIADGALDFLGENQTATVTSTILLDDGYSGGTDTATVTITISGANDAPTVTTAAGDSAGTTLPETNAGLMAQGTETLTDVDLTDTATVSVVGVTHTGPTGGLSDTTLQGYFSVPGTTFLAGSATSTQFTRTFDSQGQAFDFLAAGETLVLHYTIRPSDGHTALGTGDGVVTITITGTNDAPAISGAGNTVGYTEQAAAVAVDSAIVVGDVDTSTLAGATATISSGYQSGDVLTINGTASGDIGAIHYQYDSGTHAIVLSGTDTLAHYQAALRLVSYANATNDDPTAGGAAPSRTVTWVANDGQDTGVTATSTINVTPVNDAPVAHNDSISNAAPTGSGWLLNTDNGHYYRLVTTSLSWSAANAAAQSDGAYLATITSQTEQDFVRPLAVGNRAWLGGGSTDDLNGAGHFSWLTGPEAGSAFNYTHWRAGEPNGGGSATQFVHIEGVDDAANGGWNDAAGGATGRDFIEEWGGQAGQVAFREDTGATLTTAQLLANDTDVDSGNLTVSATSAHGGTVTLSGNIVTYRPIVNYAGSDSFTYTISDGSLTSSATVSFNVAPVADTFTGTVNNDTFSGFGGNDTFNGLDAFDRVNYVNASGAIAVNLQAGTVIVAGVGTDHLNGIEGIRGSNFNDTFDASGFTGDSHVPGTPIGYNEFEGRGGDDTITGLVNSQGAPITRVSYVNATAGVTVDIANHFAQGDGSVGHDTFVGTGISQVIGSAFVDNLIGSSNPNGTVEVFDGRGGDDIINGGGGFDRVDYNGDVNTTSGISVNLALGTVTTINPADLTMGNDTLISIEAVRGTVNNDTYNALGFGSGSTNAGSNGTFNEFTGVGGTDTVIGNGNTRLAFTSATSAVSVDMQTGSTPGTGVATASFGTINFSGVNAIMASMSNDTLLGSSNNDTFTGLGGDDFINGRGGFDVASYNNIYFVINGGVTVDMARGTATGDPGSIGNDTLRSIEGIQGTSFADTYVATHYGSSDIDPVTGLPYANVGNNGTFNQFEGMGGDDTVTGNGNTKVVYFNALDGVTVDLAAGTGRGNVIAGDPSAVGQDHFIGGVNAIGGSSSDDFLYGSNNLTGTTESFEGRGGDDWIDGRGGFDQATYNTDLNTTAGISVDMALGTVTTTGAAIGSDTLRSIESIIGTRFADTYVATGFNGASTNAGSNGTFNSFQGVGGGDTITGNGNTQIVYVNAGAGVTADLLTGLATAAGDPSFGTDHFTLVNAISGSAFDDTFSGDANANSFNGQGGNDRLDGRGGNDTLTGGLGADTFVYSNGGGADTITDFNHAQGDRIDLSGLSGISSLADVQSYVTSTSGNAVIDFGGGNSITLQGVTAASLVASDFIFGDKPALDGNNATVIPSGNNDGITTVFGIHLTDNDSAAVLSVTASADHGSVAPSSNPGPHESDVNALFNTGIVYTPTSFNNAVALNDTVTVNVTDSHSGLTDTLHFVFQQSGPGGTSLTGTGGKDIIFSTGGNDTLTGLSGSDNFVFSTNFGHDTIADFMTGSDHIDLRALSATVDSANIAPWLASHTTTNGTDTFITFDSANAITLHNVAIGSLHVGDFIVAPH